MLGQILIGVVVGVLTTFAVLFALTILAAACEMARKAKEPCPNCGRSEWTKDRWGRVCAACLFRPEKGDGDG